MKPWYTSLTFWSVIVAAVGQALSQSGHQTVGNVLSAVGAAGALYGRSRATGPLTRR